MPDFLHGIEVIQIDTGLRAIRTVKSSVIGLIGTADAADADKFPLDTPVLVTGPVQAADLGATGTLADAYDAVYAQGVNIAVVVRVAEGVDAAATLANVVGTAAAQSGVYAFLSAATLTGQTPRIIAAPGHTTPAAPGAINPVTAALTTIVDRLKAVAVIDGPNTTEADALTYRALLNSERLYLVDPAVQVFDTTAAETQTRPASGYVAGVISRTDQEKGFWHSPSNKVVQGITGVARPVAWAISDVDTEANRLNAAEVTTITRIGDGFRVWGNRGLASDPQWAFLSVRRTADMIYEAIEAAHLWALDRPFSAQLMLDVRDSVQAYLDRLTALGALLGGMVTINPELNDQTTLAAGQLYVDFDIEPPAGVERITFRAHRNGDYYDELVAAVAAA